MLNCDYSLMGCLAAPVFGCSLNELAKVPIFLSLVSQRVSQQLLLFNLLIFSHTHTQKKITQIEQQKLKRMVAIFSPAASSYSDHFGKTFKQGNKIDVYDQARGNIRI